MASVSQPEPRPAYELYPYQKAWVEDDARFKGAVKSVRIGWTVGESVDVALRLVRRKTDWLWMAGTAPQSREAAEWVAKHLQAMEVVARPQFGVKEMIEDAEITLDRITLPNGSRAIFFPANPDAARSFGGNVTLDEFAQHKDQKKIWAGMVPRAARGHRVRVFSSPKGAVGKFYELARKAGLADGVEPAGNPVRHGPWSWHWCDIHRAVRLGAQLDATELREAIDDDEVWEQEFLCIFHDAASQYIPNELIDAAVSPDASMALPAGLRPRGPMWMGMDVGRTSDLTVHALLEQVGERFIVRCCDIQRKATFAAQKARAKEYIAVVRRAALDAGGLGMQNAEELKKEHPSKVEPVTFDLDIKSAMAAWMKRKFEDRLIEIPGEPLVKQHIRAVKRLITEAGNVRFDGARTKDGHVDIFWALALAGHASDGPRQTMAEYGFDTGAGVITSGGIQAMESGGGAGGGDWFHRPPRRARPQAGAVL